MAGTFIAPGELFGVTLANGKLHPVRGLLAEMCTKQMGEEGASYEHLLHFCMDCTPSMGEELQSEYFMAYGYAADVILALEGL